MGGYRTYTGNITVDKTENSFTVTLSQTPVGEEDNPYDIDNGDEYISQNPDLTPGPTRPDEGNRPSEGDTTSEMPVKIDDELTITIYCTNGTEVYFNGTYMGEVANGKLVVPKYIGTFEIDLYLEGYDIVPYTMEVEDDNENVEITLPGFY